MAVQKDVTALMGVFKVLSDETRLRILAILQNNELAVGELQKILEIGQSTLSSHLGLLREQKLVSTKKEGQKVYYRFSQKIQSHSEYHVILETLSTLQGSEWLANDRLKLEHVLKERYESTKHFFNSLSDEEDVPPSQSWELLALGLLQLVSAKKIIDLGCGTGKVALMLYRAGKEVTGIDSSEKRLTKAQQHFNEIKQLGKPQTNLSSLTFLQADMEHTGLPSKKADLVLLSQSLHHVAKPFVVLQEAFRLLSPSGQLVIWDLCSHQEDWIRKKFGDFWLGFSIKTLEQWLCKCGFKKITTMKPQDLRHTANIQPLIISAKK